MFVRIWIIGWAVFATSASAVVYKVETETSSRHSILAEELANTTNANIIYSRWSEWTEWSACSRSCGGGVRSQTRTCLESSDAKSGKYAKYWSKKRSKLKMNNCTGISRRNQICNDMECPPTVKDFRATQCEYFNQKAFAGMYYSWEPFYDDKNQCALNCRPLSYKFYATLSSSVIDGTPCTLQSSERSVCVDGKCQFVGCDGIIGGQIYDICGVCGGNNSTCRLVSGLFTKPFLNSGYNYITEIPEHACNLNISEVKRTANLIALRFKNGSFVLNGDFQPSPPGAIEAAGTTFTFFRGSIGNAGDFVFSPGPLSQPLELLLLYRQVNPGIKYEYRVPMPKTFRDSAATKGPVAVSNYDYKPGLDFSNFEDTERHKKYYTTSSDTYGDNSEFQDSINDEEFKPKHASKKRKNKYLWKITSYTPCSRTCGEGTRMGIYSCVKENDQERIVPDRRCISAEKPENKQLQCNLRNCPAEWVTGDWSTCSVTCGEGIERRDLVCVQEITPLEKIQAGDDACAPTPPPNVLRTRPCFRKPCDNGSAVPVKPYWKTSTWSLCSARCGPGVKTREVRCMAESEDECNASERPATETSCDMGPCQSQGVVQWLTTEWSEKCSESCGTGVQSRKLACSIGTRDDSPCSEDTKPETLRSCSSNDQCGGRWFSGPWSRCSVDCGWGKETRSLVCLAYDRINNVYQLVSDQNCNEKEKPSIEQACFTKQCDADWYSSPWSQCSRSCDSGIQTRRVRCMREDYSPSAGCNEENKPSIKQSCNLQRCNYMTEALNSSPQTLLYNGSSCSDEYSNCNLVVQARLCSYKYYQQHCCKSCYGIKQHHATKSDGQSDDNKTT